MDCSYQLYFVFSSTRCNYEWDWLHLYLIFLLLHPLGRTWRSRKSNDSINWCCNVLKKNQCLFPFFRLKHTKFSLIWDRKWSYNGVGAALNQQCTIMLRRQELLVEQKDPELSSSHRAETEKEKRIIHPHVRYVVLVTIVVSLSFISTIFERVCREYILFLPWPWKGKVPYC